MWPALVASPPREVGAPSPEAAAAATSAPADPDSRPPEARAPPVVTVREADTPAASREAGCAAAAPSPGPKSACM
eukprot:1123865-Prymnesium_polylepis.1